MKKFSSPLRLTHQKAKVLQFARKLRKNMTPEERTIWEEVRRDRLGCRWRRQVPLGIFVADFCCMKHRVIIEIDGKQHDQMIERDEIRDAHLRKMSKLTIVRIPNERVRRDLSGVLEMMRRACNPSSDPSPTLREK